MSRPSLWKLTIYTGDMHSLVLLGDRSWQAEVRLYRWRWQARLARRFVGLRRTAATLLTKTELERYWPDRNVISLAERRSTDGPAKARAPRSDG